MVKKDVYRIIIKEIFNSEGDIPKQILQLLDSYKIPTKNIVNVFLRKLNEQENNCWTLKSKTQYQKHAYMEDLNSDILTLESNWTMVDSDEKLGSIILFVNKVNGAYITLESNWTMAHSDEKLDSILFVNKVNGAVITFAQMPSKFWQGEAFNSKLFSYITLNTVLDNDFNNDYIKELLFNSYLEALLVSDFKLTVFNKLKEYYKKHLKNEKGIIYRIKELEQYLTEYQKELIRLYGRKKELEGILEKIDSHEHYYPTDEKSKKTDFINFLKNVKLVNGYGSNIASDLNEEHFMGESVFFDDILNYYFIEDKGKWFYRLNGTAILNGKTSSGNNEASLDVTFKNVKAPVNDSLRYLFSLFDTLIRKGEIFINDDWDAYSSKDKKFWELVGKYKTSFPENYIITEKKHSIKLDESIEMVENFIEKLQTIKDMASYENLSNLIISDKASRDEAIGIYLRHNRQYQDIFEDEPFPFDGPAYKIEKGNYGNSDIQFDSFYGNDCEVDYIREISSWIIDIANYYIEIFRYILHHNMSLKDYGSYHNYIYNKKCIDKLTQKITKRVFEIKEAKARLFKEDSNQVTSYKFLINYYNCFIKDNDKSKDASELKRRFKIK